MGFFDLFRSTPPDAVAAMPRTIYADGGLFYGYNDSRLIEYLRDGNATQSGVCVSVRDALKNTAVFRSVCLISYSIGMLPLHLLRGGDDFEVNKADDHELFNILYSEPNDWQTAFDFRSHMQLNALLYGNAYAKVIRSRGRILHLIPLDPEKVEPKLGSNWKLTYKYEGKTDLDPADVFHLRGLSLDGLKGMSLVKQAAETIGLAISAEAAAARLFRNGMLVGGSLRHPNKLSPEAFERLKASMEERHSGAENAHKWMILEEGMTAEKMDHTAVDSQQLETRKHQIEEIGRVFGVPRPLLGVDDTSWGTGIEQLGIGFVRYGLNQWFTAWEQAIKRTLLVGDEKKTLSAKFNEGALLRGSMNDQANFFAKALGSGGHQPWMHVDEVRALSNLNKRDDLVPPAGVRPPGEKPNENAQAA